MITVDEWKVLDNGGLFSFRGKSTDEKPTDKFYGMMIENGSTFLEIDTQSVKFFDADTNTWL